MYEVARRAGVGQATLYRNFPDRPSLAAALVAEHMERSERLAIEHAEDPDAFFILLRGIVESVARFHSLGELASETRLRSASTDVAGGSRRSGRRPLPAAKRPHAARRTIEDLFLAAAMAKARWPGSRVRGARRRQEPRPHTDAGWPDARARGR